MNKQVTITPKQGHTGKDHLLPEIARKAREQLKAEYSSTASARKAAARAWFRVCRSSDLYRGCEAGFSVS
jgi:hypothetical protein